MQLHASLRRLALASASLTALAAAAPASAQEVTELVVTAPNYVPTGVVTASKSLTPLVETPQSVTVITRDQIDLLDWNNLSQTVRYTAGVTGENYGPDERVDWLTMRGFNPVQYVDGLQAAIGSITNTGLDLYGAESVELLKGPSSVLYGQTPPGGIVNVTSRRPSFAGDGAASGEIGFELGNYEHKQAHVDANWTLSNNVAARVTALFRDKGTQVTDVNSDRLYVAPALTWRASDDTSITLLSYLQKDQVNGDGGGFLPSQGVLTPNPLGRVSTSTNLGETSYNRFKRTHYGIGYEANHRFNDSLSLQQNLKVTHLEGDQRGVGGGGLLDNDFNGVPDDYRTVTRYSFSFAEDVDTVSVDTRLNGQFSTGALTHELLVGLDFRRYDYVGKSAFAFGMPTIDLFAPVYGVPIAPLAPVTFSDQLQTQTGLYVQDQIKLGQVIFTGAVRHDWVETEDRIADNTVDDAEFSYRAALSYEFSNGVVPYLAWSKSFQPTPGADSAGSPFEPTTGEQTELGVKYDARNAPAGVKMFATAALYQLTQQNVLTTDPSNSFFQVQTGEVEVQGVELEFVGRFQERLSLNASYTYTDSEVTKSEGPDLGGRLPVTPRHKASALADYTFQDGSLAGLGASLGVRYTSDSAGNLASVFTPEVFINPAVTLWDASVHYDVSDWRLAVTASNLFDEEYVARCYSASNCFFGTRRVVVASATRRF